MAAIEDLIKQIADSRLRDQLAAEVARLKEKKTFGLVFEDHLPELLQLPNVAPTVGARVLKKDDPQHIPYRVTAEVNGKKIKAAPESGGPEETLERSAVVVARAFGEPMYPALIPVDTIERAPGKPWHVLINADNYHALQLLLYGYENKVDVIYIDPPYNTGARDWKYNNDYVDKADNFRHSKWLSMMKKRLALAKRLLKATGIMVVAIDDYEAHHLRCLLEEEFDPGAFLGVVVVRSKPSGSQTEKGLAVSHEYALFIGGSADAGVQALERNETQRARFDQSDEISPFWWENLRRAGSNSRREDRPKLFYPIWVSKTGEIQIPKMEWNAKVRSWTVLEKLPRSSFEVFPVREDGTERNWSWSHTKVAGSLSEVRAEKSGLEWSISRKRRMRRAGVLPHTIWYDKRYSASEHGTNLLRQLLGEGERFSYPKSLYTVMESIRCATDDPDAIVLDFFGGSATTLNAVAALNAEDEGRRRCFIVTNNEVGEKTARRLISEAVEPESSKWNREGIAESVTWPRIKACVTGQRPDGSEIPGEYLDGCAMADGFEENAAYFKLDFLDPTEVNKGDKFESIVPILWMLAGCRGAPEVSRGSGKWFIPKQSPFAVLLKEDEFVGFAEAVAQREDIEVVFLVTDSADHFHRMSKGLGKKYRYIQLYRSYIDTFRINLTEPGTISASGTPVQPTPAATKPVATEGGK